jgi:putative transposase
VCASFKVQLTEFIGKADHVHLLVNFPLHVALSKLVNSLKACRADCCISSFPKLEAKFWNNVL